MKGRHMLPAFIIYGRYPWGRRVRDQPGISRFRLRRFASPRNDDSTMGGGTCCRLSHAGARNSFLILKTIGQFILACAARIQLAQKLYSACALTANLPFALPS